METIKNKIAKGIKISLNGALYCAVFVSSGCWFRAQEKIRAKTKIRPMPYTKIDQNPISTEIDQNTPNEPIIKHSIEEKGIANPTFTDNPTDDNKNVSRPPHAEAVCAGQQPTMSQAALGLSHNNTNSNHTPVPGKNNAPRSTVLGQLNPNVDNNIPSDSPKENRDGGKVDNDQLQRNQSSVKANLQQSYSYMDLLMLPSIPEKIRSLDEKKLKTSLEGLIKIRDQYTKCNKKNNEALLNQINTLLGNNSIAARINLYGNDKKSKKVKKNYIISTSDLAQHYIKILEKEINSDSAAS